MTRSVELHCICGMVYFQSEVFGLIFPKKDTFLASHKSCMRNFFPMGLRLIAFGSQILFNLIKNLSKNSLICENAIA